MYKRLWYDFMKHEDLHTILAHFEEPVFPRTISTKTTAGTQVEAKNIEETYARFKQSNFIDCRINAYPSYTNYNGINRQSPNFVMCDLDLMKFRTEKLLLKTLYKTTENITKDIGGVPTILFTGNGYHVYQPIHVPILENESIFARFQNPSTELIRYAAQRWTNGKNDPSNHPSVNSCLLRVPGSINSKNNKVVEVVQLWNKNRPAANSMLFDFYIKLAAKEFAFRSKQKDYYYYYKNKSTKKNYKHFGDTNNTNPVQQIDWIEGLLEGRGTSDYRQLAIDLVLAPYLVNVKKYDYDAAYNTIEQWLDKCSQKRPLRFNVRYKVNYALNRSRREATKPMKLDTMKVDYADMYKEIILKDKVIFS
jgi:hypothetical protein